MAAEKEFVKEKPTSPTRIMAKLSSRPVEKRNINTMRPRIQRVVSFIFALPYFYDITHKNKTFEKTAHAEGIYERVDRDVDSLSNFASKTKTGRNPEKVQTD
jgi:hypothetical protein